MDNINEALERPVNQDVKYRFVISETVYHLCLRPTTKRDIYSVCYFSCTWDFHKLLVMIN